jgi:hypothetical protein
LADHIGNEYFNFYKLDHDVVELEELNKADILDFYNDFSETVREVDRWKTLLEHVVLSEGVWGCCRL